MEFMDMYKIPVCVADARNRHKSVAGVTCLSENDLWYQNVCGMEIL